ncbi:MAG: bifunctional 5,10-methylenetetrahydrofolate dehydrogenase/5,10-methenyltetrahydrofolate cyclohydrolase [Planctomycetaceae bacterium]|nr:MAG: bifunctional 5,10-methylenetetrahydrofolate dehydrogenase/5,10-methenyltetrahydrofolate cyclohydrolase [Planctomycetaceae bacterium]
MTARLIDGKAIAESFRADIARRAAELKALTGVTPFLTAVLTGDDPASAVYVKNKHAACEKAGFGSEVIRLSAETSERALLEVVARLNGDPKIHGILVQLPVPRQVDSQKVLDAVAPLKDVDCFHPENVGRLAQGRPRFLPCTPAGVQRLLIESGIETAGRHVVVLGRSDIVGKPLAMMLIQKGPGANATVTVCHSQTRDLPAITRSADILVAAIGVPRFVTREMVKPGAVVIDVGINRLDGKLVGDVDFGPVAEVAGAITPVPGGVGPMTITLLLENTLTAARLQAGG